ncbi:asparagine synthetase domain-containing protein CG17486 [Leguminivora glycinivorella]|uniref:asparagine synthetase domain-containing protein CG17486 n=1 Tax=Leguminivora glycinivorella TaxID=1035111 RepID=UPI00200C5F6A|nr:asparagine synthetase domain-containing protein CG17486 [Leguminivora glycinivorella]
MCGIICEICYSSSVTPKVYNDSTILQRIKNRGPDCVNTTEINAGGGKRLYFCGAVLWMQGQELTPQPVENDVGILLYNGDIFDESWNEIISDTMTIMNNLSSKTEISAREHIVAQLKLLKGPFSIFYYDKITEELYFTRDRIGRNSLLFHKMDNNCIAISSVLDRRYNCIEIPATHIYCLNIKTNKVTLYSWTSNETEIYLVEDLYESLLRQQNKPDEDFKIALETPSEVWLEDDLIEFLRAASKIKDGHMKTMETCLSHPTIKKTVEKLTELLQNSVKIRLKRQPNKCKNCLISTDNSCSHSTIGVLFSGGLDCTILAYLAHRYISEEQSIDLINVAFKKDSSASYDVPDRLTGRQSFEELKTICPSRKWNFIEVNVPREELEEYQLRTIADLVFPRKTILDESLGSALWFASRGQVDDKTSPCRVLLLGSGADELFGGYKRHYNAFKRHSWPGLSEELLLDWKRISFRNLARDNRVICDHGRQPRMPYLDENFTDYVLNLKPWLKCFPNDDFGPGIGDKLMLRLVAFNLGLRNVVILPKRALQFGSRIANKKEKGSDLSSRFLNT